MADDVDHIILTRFNLPSQGLESFIRAREGWLRDRIELFERYCLPSVRRQTSQQFRWIIYFDPESPRWLRDRIDMHVSCGSYVPIFRSSVTSAALIDDIRNVTGGCGSRLITTNLDNDDALAVDFIARLQAALPEQNRTAIYLTRGLIKSHSRLYLRLDRHNAFGSVAENWTSPSTCWSDWHTLLAKSMPVIEIHGQPAWLQVVHCANVSNRVRGRLVAPDAYAHLFPGLVDDVPTPRLLDRAVDALAGQPRRLALESARAVLKWVAMRFLGKGGLELAKAQLASWRARYRPRAR